MCLAAATCLGDLAEFVGAKIDLRKVSRIYLSYSHEDKQVELIDGESEYPGCSLRRPLTSLLPTEDDFLAFQARMQQAKEISIFVALEDDGGALVRSTSIEQGSEHLTSRARASSVNPSPAKAKRSDNAKSAAKSKPNGAAAAAEPAAAEPGPDHGEEADASKTGEIQKRKRRTKAEMEAARAAQAQAQAGAGAETEAEADAEPASEPETPKAKKARKSKSKAEAADESARDAETEEANGAETENEADGDVSISGLKYCGVCNAKPFHPADTCPTVKAGDKSALKDRLEELKALKQKKKGPERLAQKDLKRIVKSLGQKK